MLTSESGTFGTFVGLDPIKYFELSSGHAPFIEWLESLDKGIQARIVNRIVRLEQGNFGDHKHIDGGVYELRLFFGSGYRVYYGVQGKKLVILLNGGDKKSQPKDIKLAKKFWDLYLSERRI